LRGQDSIDGAASPGRRYFSHTLKERCMAQQYKVAVLVGSLRKDSLNRKTANALMAMSPPTLQMSAVEIGELPLYNQDLEAQPPAPWVAFREQIAATQALLFVTPEYNRSVPGGLKNALDVGSRP